MIPKIIWQTYESSFEELPKEAKNLVKIWKEKNPEWEYCYMDSRQRDDFVLKEFGKEWFDIYSNINLGIIKANIWRCMVVYKYGGVYSDLDTLCIEPIESWIKEDFSLTVAKDDDGNPIQYAIYLFAGKPGSVFLNNLINDFKNNITKYQINQKNVGAISGEIAWYLKLNLHEKYYDVYCYNQGSNVFNGKAAKHMAFNRNWENYQSWDEGLN
jgi:mannosyltransferase OCH1-like enzyme